MITTDRTLTLYNVEYEMKDANGQDVTWKANILAHGEAEDAINFIRRYTKKGINVMSISDIGKIDGVTDRALQYMNVHK
jgi:hypothetical protein